MGIVALADWLAARSTGNGLLAAAGLLAWWGLTVVRLMLLARWSRSSGKHSDDKATDEWGEGVGLSALGHFGMLVGAVYFTFVVFTNRL